MMMRYLAEGVQKLGLVLTPEQQAAFQCYRDELVAWKTRANLTAITDDEGIQTKHFLDSLSCLKAISDSRFQISNCAGQSETSNLKSEIKMADVGTGAGFPGLPLKIVCSSIRLTLIEATGKKVDFLNHIIAALGLRSVTVVKARAEDVGQDQAHREQYDWAVARAVAEMPTLAEYLLPLVRIGGKALAQKNDNAPAEVAAAETAIHHLGGRVNRLVPLELHGIAETRYLVIIDKVAATPTKYPRRAGMPAKRPIS
jgi:16S rRNA (guanine527-N7)-methyltransferase